MAYATATAAQLTTDAPLDEALVKDVLQNNDKWLYEDATAGSGVDPNVTAMKAAMGAHSHDGTDGQGEPIPAAGIASNAVNNSDMMGTNSVSTGKLANTTVNTDNFGTAAVENDKWTGTLGTAISGAQNYDYGQPPRGSPHFDVAIEGDTLILSNPKGALGVIVNQGQADWYILEMSSSEIKFGMRTAVHTGFPSSTGTWNVNCRII